MQHPTFASVTKQEVPGVLRKTSISSLVLCKPTMLPERLVPGKAAEGERKLMGPGGKPAHLPSGPHRAL